MKIIKFCVNLMHCAAYVFVTPS